MLLLIQEKAKFVIDGLSKRRIALICLLALIVSVILRLIENPNSLDSENDSLPLLLIFSLIGIVVLTIVVIHYVVRFIKRYRRRIPGTALGIQFLVVFTLVMFSALGLVYGYSFLTLHRSVDSWFDLQVGDAVKDVNLVEDLFIESLQDKVVSEVQDSIDKIKPELNLEEVSEILFDVRQTGNYQEVTYFVDLTSPTGIVASAGVDIESLVPQRPSENLINRALVVSENQPVGEILKSEDDEPRQLRVLIPIPTKRGDNKTYLQVITTLRESSVSLLERIGFVNLKYEQLDTVFASFRFSLVLTLTLVTLLSMLLATWILMAITHRLVAPFQTLSEGTQSVAKGIFDELPVTGISDDLAVLFLSFNEMTKRIKSSQQQLRKTRLAAEGQKRNLEIVLRHLSSGVLFIDRSARLTNINLAAERILNVNTDEVIEKHLGNLKRSHKQMAPLFIELLNGIQNQQDELSDTVYVDTADGRRVLAYSSTRLLLMVEGGVNYVIVIEDITDLVRAQRGIAWGEYAKRMAHEILNPLQPIRLAVDRIRMKTQLKLTTADSQSLNLAFAAINRQLDFIQVIVNQFRHYQSISNRNLSQVDLNALIQEAVELHYQDGTSLRIELELDSNLPQFTADATQLIQVLNNLLINAKDAVSQIKQPMIKILTQSVKENTVILTILDNGPGFDSDLLEGIFEPYATTKKKGTGLGLAIVQRIVNSHNGKITASNRKTGGAKFTIELDIRSTGIVEPKVTSSTDIHIDREN